MRGSHAYFQGAGNLRLHYRSWHLPSPRAVILVAHGLGEHSGRYEELAHDFARAGLSTYALDHRGHGRSDGRKGHVRRFSHYIQDFEKFRRRVVAAAARHLPTFFLGHSLGGLILLRYLQEYPGVTGSGAIISAPLLGFAMDVPDWKEKLAEMLLYVAPALPMTTRLPPDLLSHDLEIVEAYRRDPLVHDRITPRLYRELKGQLSTVRRKRDRLRLPMLFLLPGDDRLADTEVSREFVAELRDRADVQQRLYPGLYHEVLNEVTRPRTIADVLGWMERRIAPTGSAAPSPGS